MDLEKLIDPESIAPALRASSKKQMLQELANRVAERNALDARSLFDALMERERLGATAMGRGVAIPHARMPGVDRMTAYFARLEKPVDYDAPDGLPVDLVMMLLAPENAGADHLRALARVSRLLRDEGRCAKLRSTSDPAAHYALLVEDLASSNAA
ncbi:PTS sugar transporter subunit IIA [Oceanicella actignis]|uniref:PTS system, nitrogen regulatory IIA component n=1 Tax=Oceanicella actignis TaxID=1189325 RepID=A0A1M7TE75_9RHOB|nr:PTS sugar transporter subunit IIA [Oceanicella actignis]TYO88599.1 phosphotransferase IIA-like nitrogen-regulatory protein PtsN [Oceanicella actignis]SET62611.1 PTS IIA-like nitrogen-regulatory protein PtsN [Oceanicella actignis]SHN69030.1 PTS system, nitrogen regulatory IIA component [Oceanicella actignis]